MGDRVTLPRPLDETFALVKALYENGYGVEMLLAPADGDEEGAASVTLLLPAGVTDEWTKYASWQRLVELAARFHVVPEFDRSGKHPHFGGFDRPVVTFRPDEPDGASRETCHRCGRDLDPGLGCEACAEDDALREEDRCSECGNAKVGPQPPYTINHEPDCSRGDHG